MSILETSRIGWSKGLPGALNENPPGESALEKDSGVPMELIELRNGLVLDSDLDNNKHIVIIIITI